MDVGSEFYEPRRDWFDHGHIYNSVYLSVDQFRRPAILDYGHRTGFSGFGDLEQILVRLRCFDRAVLCANRFE